MYDWMMDDSWERAGMPNGMPWPQFDDEHQKEEEPAK